MKLIIAIVQDQDIPSLIDDLTEEEFRVTRLASTGGFLRSGNTTILMGVPEERMQEALKIIGDNCQTREITTSLLTVSMPGDTYIPYPLEVQVGGAVLFILDIEQYIRI
ncbi:MAG: hypothetical protein GX329_05465 [Tissierellia bacterium]|nr:hypothetical protein [Tissierellia bacterium]